MVIDHEAATFHSAGLTPAQMRGQVTSITAGFIGTTLEVAALIKDDLKLKTVLQAQYHVLLLMTINQLSFQP